MGSNLRPVRATQIVNKERNKQKPITNKQPLALAVKDFQTSNALSEAGGKSQLRVLCYSVLSRYSQESAKQGILPFATAMVALSCKGVLKESNPKTFFRVVRTRCSRSEGVEEGWALILAKGSSQKVNTRVVRGCYENAPSHFKIQAMCLLPLQSAKLHLNISFSCNKTEG